ncbi:DUF2780 domain-containing protein [Caulobacter sp. NIBR2454]|uniref:DUF2780 domain-containing protein n=1 Tax=Caulobacter sp. NIBR2454 TaxID=3015996 RepID=UPI0022B62915|nr:DUF2780 domain-containing protein [Caulobacter sp. NIBR2454]
MIEDLIVEISAKTSLSHDQARKALAGALSLIAKHGEPAKVAQLFSAAPGAEGLAAEAAAAPAKSGLFGGLMKAAGGAGGAAMSDAMAMMQKLSRDGISSDGLQAMLPVAGEWVRERAGGRDLLGDTLASIPGVGGMLGRKA